ncbi:unnamed protein product [Durusdinium trenchii]|uniref:Uncharacterized protein n=1 Tax=Durusdinium trenchii TaxID=1381693 RepID=A0ABP0LMQ6_9DINO
MEHLQQMHLDPPNIDKFLLSDDHPAVQAELERLTAKANNKAPAAKEKWVSLHMTVAEERR